MSYQIIIDYRCLFELVWFYLSFCPNWNKIYKFIGTKTQNMGKARDWLIKKLRFWSFIWIVLKCENGTRMGVLLGFTLLYKKWHNFEDEIESNQIESNRIRFEIWGLICYNLNSLRVEPKSGVEETLALLILWGLQRRDRGWRGRTRSTSARAWSTPTTAGRSGSSSSTSPTSTSLWSAGTGSRRWSWRGSRRQRSRRSTISTPPRGASAGSGPPAFDRRPRSRSRSRALESATFI